jgi:hypothetical protein
VSTLDEVQSSMQITTATYKMHSMACGCWLRERLYTQETIDHHLCKYHASHGNAPKITVIAFYKLVTKYGRSRNGTCAMCSATFGTVKELKAHKIDKHAY